MSKIEVDAIEPQSGTTLTIGASGDSVNIASGATITDFTSTGIDDNATSTAITIDSSERVGIGIASPSANLEVRGASSNGQIYLGGSTTDTYGKIYSDNDGILIASADAGNNAASSYFGVEVDGTERMKIGSNGKLTFTTNAAGDNGMIFINANADPFGLQMDFSTGSPDNNSRTFQLCEDSTTTRMIVYSDGDLANHDGVYGSISDERIKQDIRDSNSQWNDIKNIRVRNFKKKDDVRQYGDNAWEQIGVIAQELETVSPKLIKHSNPTQSDILSDSSFGTLYQEEDEIPEGKKVGDIKEVHDQIKKVSYSVLYMKSIKALQEAMERIEQLEAKVTALENK
jgi:hypothetical protein